MHSFECPMWPHGQVFTVAALQICGGNCRAGSNDMRGTCSQLPIYLSMPANQARGRPEKGVAHLGMVVCWSPSWALWQSQMKSSLFISIELKKNELLSSLSIWSWSNLMWCMHRKNMENLSILDEGPFMGKYAKIPEPWLLDLRSRHYRNVMPLKKHDLA